MPLPRELRTPVCIGCGRRPHELREYVEMLRDCPDTWLDEDAYVRDQEGTYNPENGHFLCTPCYIKAGSPSSRTGWKAP